MDFSQNVIPLKSSKPVDILEIRQAGLKQAS